MFVPKVALMSVCGLLGYTCGSHSEGWTPIPTARCPATGKEEYSFVHQDPP